MTCYHQIQCPHCGSSKIKKSGKNPDCSTQTFMLDYTYKAYEPGIKEKIVNMAINASGVRDTARVLGINKNTVISTLKKKKKI